VEFDDPTGIISDRASDRPLHHIPSLRPSRRPSSTSDRPVLRSVRPPPSTRPPVVTTDPRAQAAISADLDDSLREMIEERSQSKPFVLPHGPVTAANLFDDFTQAPRDYVPPAPSVPFVPGPPVRASAVPDPVPMHSGTRRVAAPTQAAHTASTRDPLRPPAPAPNSTAAFLSDDPVFEEADRERRRFPQDFIRPPEITPRPDTTARPAWMYGILLAVVALASLWVLLRRG